MRTMILFATGALALSAGAATMPLEWNVLGRTDVPYEVELSPSKLGAASFCVCADGRPLPTAVLPGKRPGNVALRFSVPAGTKALSCETRTGRTEPADAATVDNLFAGALEAPAVARWKLPTGVKAVVEQGGLRFVADATAPVRAYATYEIPVPDGLPGKPVMQEIALTSHAKLAWGGTAVVDQLDARGRRLADSLCDVRWTTHMRPPERETCYRDEGHIHPEAKTLRFRLELHRLTTSHDDFGRKVTDPSVLLPSVSLSRLAVRVAERLPFPKWNDAFFGNGVSGREGDCSLRLGGAEGKAIFYQTTSRGTWTEKAQPRGERDLFFPSGEGTVEAWFRPDWKALDATRRAKGWKAAPVTLFEAYGGHSAVTFRRDVTRVLAVDYHPVKNSWHVLLADCAGHSFEKTVPAACPLKDGEWTHVAFQWTPGETAALFVNGAETVRFPIAGFETVSFTDGKVSWPSDRWAMEFYCGSRAESVRLHAGVSPAAPLFEGEVDNLRVSTGCRYAGDRFVPPRTVGLDDRTRALFTFDRTFDGVSGGGLGFIPACMRALVDRVDHMVALDGKPVAYYPAALTPENDPARVLDINNYPQMPTDEDYRQATVLKTRRCTLANGDRTRLDCGERAYPAFVRIANTSSTEPLRYPILLQKGGLDPRSFGDLSATLLARRMSDRENVNAVFQYAIGASDYFMSHQVDAAPGTDCIHQATYDALTMLNSYCGFECGPLNNMTANMLTTVAQCPASQTGGYGHSFQQVFFDGKNHIYDLSAQTFFPAMDNETAAYLKEAADQPGIFNRMGRSGDHFIRKGARGSGAQDPSYVEKCAMTLNPGETLTLSYANDGRFNNLQMYNYKGYSEMPTLAPDNYDYAGATGLKSEKTWVLRRDRIFPHYSTAVVSFDGRPDAKSPAVTVSDGAFTYRITSCYPIVWGEYAAYRADGSRVELDLSTDRGATFRPLPDGGDGVYTLEYRVKARHEYLVRVKAPIASVARVVARTEGMVNPRTYPGWPRAGENELTFRSDPGPAADVTFGWREPAREIVVSPTAKSGTLPGFTRELVLVDPTRPLTLDVKGADRAVARGRVRADLRDGRLTLAYDAARPSGIVHGDDNPESIGEFPAFAGVDLFAGDAVKTLTVLVAPQARLALADDPKTSDRKTFAFEALPKGDYLVFVLARFESAPKSTPVGHVSLVDPSDGKKHWPIARQINGNFNFLKAQMGTTGQRANWKWDTAIMGKEWRQSTYNGFSFRTFSFPEGTAKIDLQTVQAKDKPIETAAVLVLPACDVDARRDLRTILFGMNCDPFHDVPWCADGEAR